MTTATVTEIPARLEAVTADAFLSGLECPPCPPRQPRRGRPAPTP